MANSNTSPEAYKAARELRPEYAIEVVGSVNKRPEGTINKDLASGSVEVEASQIKILAKAWQVFLLIVAMVYFVNSHFPVDTIAPVPNVAMSTNSPLLPKTSPVATLNNIA